MQHASNCHGYSPGSVSHYHAPLTGCVVSVSVGVWGGCGGFTGSRPVFLDCVADGGQGQGGQGGGAGDHREDQARQVQGENRTVGTDLSGVQRGEQAYAQRSGDPLPGVEQRRAGRGRPARPGSG